MLSHCHRLERPIDAMQCNAEQSIDQPSNFGDQPKATRFTAMRCHTVMNANVNQSFNELMKMLVELIKNACEKLHWRSNYMEEVDVDSNVKNSSPQNWQFK